MHNLKRSDFAASKCPEFFNQPAILSSESVEEYNSLLTEVLDYIDPQNIIERMLVEDIVAFARDIRFYNREKIAGIDRKYRSTKEITLKRKAIDTELKEKQADDVQRMAEGVSLTKALAERLQLVHETVDDIDGLLTLPTPGNHSAALEGSILYHERLDRLLSTAIARRNDALKMIGLCHELIRPRARYIIEQLSRQSDSEQLASPEP